jgi:hypothetical protein
MLRQGHDDDDPDPDNSDKANADRQGSVIVREARDTEGCSSRR